MEILNNIFYMSIFGTVMFFIYLIFKPLTKNIFNSALGRTIVPISLPSITIPPSEAICC